MGIIVRVSQDYEGLGWVRYDSAFRRQAALSGNKKWSVVNGTPFTMNFSGRAAGTNRCELCFATSHNERERAQSGNPDPRSLETTVITMAKPPIPRPGLDSGRAMHPVVRCGGPGPVPRIPNRFQTGRIENSGTNEQWRQCVLWLS